MARNQEKAQSMLNRWTAMKLGMDLERRPALPSQCDKASKAEKWRRQVIREISEKVAIIQNASLGEHRIRDLNDEINKLLREKKAWEKRILELGGTDFTKVQQRLFDEDGTEVIAVGGYRYFGAAKLLPGVKELFARYSFKEPTKTRFDLVKAVNTDYYGYRDDDDGKLEQVEKKAEEKEIAREVERFEDVKKVRERNENVVSAVVDENKDLILDVQIPSQEEIEKMILEKRKRDVLQKYIDR